MNAAVLKTVVPQGTVGSNPTSSATHPKPAQRGLFHFSATYAPDHQATARLRKHTAHRKCAAQGASRANRTHILSHREVEESQFYREFSSIYQGILVKTDTLFEPLPWKHPKTGAQDRTSLSPFSAKQKRAHRTSERAVEPNGFCLKKRTVPSHTEQAGCSHTIGARL